MLDSDKKDTPLRKVIPLKNTSSAPSQDVSKSNMISKNISPNAFIPLDIETYDGSNQVVHPDIIAIEDGFKGYKYWMAYTPYPYANDFYENPCIAASNDGIKWTAPKDLKNPIVPSPNDYNDGGHNSDTDIIFSNGSLSVFYVYNKHGLRGPSKFYRTQSTNGVSWSSPSLIYQTDPGISGYSPAIVSKDGYLYMWYISDKNTTYFTKCKKNMKWETPVKCSLFIDGWTVWHLDVIQSDKGYEGLLCAINNKSLNKALFYIDSANGTDWESSSEPILSPPDSGWDNLDIYRATIVKSKGVYKIWYSARNKQNIWGVGYVKGNSIQSLKGYSVKLANYDIK